MSRPILLPIALVSLEEQKLYQGVHGVESDSILVHLINDCSADIVDRLGYGFGEPTKHDEWYAGSNNRSLTLRHCPIVDIELLEVSGSPVNLNTLIIDKDKGILSIRWDMPFWFGFGFAWGFRRRLGSNEKNIRVIYTAGGGPVPHNIKALCRQYVKGVYDTRSRDESLSTASLHAVRADIRDDIFSQLDRYRRILVV